MPDIKKLLVIDDDFHSYDTPIALNRAIDDLRQAGSRWTFYLHDQQRGVEAFKENHYNAVLIDNDIEVGLRTLNMILPISIPIAYVSAFTFEQLCRKYWQQRSIECLQINPEKFKELGIRFMRKRDIMNCIQIRGNKRTVTHELIDEDGVTLDTLQKDIYEISIDWGYGNYKPSLKHLIETANIINEIPFVNLFEIILYKKEFNREKDVVDIELINKYLSSTSNR